MQKAMTRNLVIHSITLVVSWLLIFATISWFLSWGSIRNNLSTSQVNSKICVHSPRFCRTCRRSSSPGPESGLFYYQWHIANLNTVRTLKLSSKKVVLQQYINISLSWSYITKNCNLDNFKKFNIAETFCFVEWARLSWWIQLEPASMHRLSTQGIRA